ncbi:MAG: hypothetical protein JKX91_03035 [Rhizobiaceae bacterium]|nr:hypothetical protein [Rhizobiaceae bacterium]
MVFLAGLVGFSVSLDKDIYKKFLKSINQVPDKPDNADIRAVPTPDSKSCLSYSVMIIDNFNKHDSGSRFDVVGFESNGHALEYGMRRARSSVRQCRKDGQSKEQNNHMWMTLGEEVSVDGVQLSSVHYDDFHDSDPTAEVGHGFFGDDVTISTCGLKARVRSKPPGRAGSLR